MDRFLGRRSDRLNRLNKYSEDVRQALANARDEARRLCHRMVGTEHLLLGILKLDHQLIEGIFVTLHVSTLRVFQAVEFVIGRNNRAILSEPTLNPAARAALRWAEEEAQSVQAELVGVEHLLLGVLREQSSITAGVLESFGVYQSEVRQRISTLLSNSSEPMLHYMRYQTKYIATPTLNQVSRDLTMMALDGQLDPLVGRENELERTIQILMRRSKNNVALIGPAGVGKTAIAEGLAQKIIDGCVPEGLRDVRVVALELGLLTAGTRMRGEFEERVKHILREIETEKGLILVLDEMHMLTGAGVAEGSMDAANLFKPMLARGAFRCIGATTLDEYRNSIESDPALERRFQIVQIQETNESETLAILRGLRPHYASFHEVEILDEALKAAVQMSARYIQGRFQPDKAIDLLDEAAAFIRVQRACAPDELWQMRDELQTVLQAKEYAIRRYDFEEANLQRGREWQIRQQIYFLEMTKTTKKRPRIVDELAIAHVVARWTGIPVAHITAEEAQRLLLLEEELHRRVVGQHHAVQAVARAIRRARTDLHDRRRPIGSFLFVGPTGVGKTELARTLAASLFGREDALLTFDMSEFMEHHLVSRLIGAPPGYVGYQEAGQLTEAVRRQPYSVLLFDEIEKAHPQVFDLLLQILEDGCLTDGQGRRVDFRQTVVIMTSNLGTTPDMWHESPLFVPRQHQQEYALSRYQRLQETVEKALKEQCKPELLNRIDEIIVFHPLTVEHLHAIVDLVLEKTYKQLKEQKITLHVSDAARSLLVEYGYHPEYGARALRRTVQRELEDMLAEALLKGMLQAGQHCVVDVVDGRLTMLDGESNVVEYAMLKSGRNVGVA